MIYNLIGIPHDKQLGYSWPVIQGGGGVGGAVPQKVLPAFRGAHEVAVHGSCWRCIQVPYPSEPTSMQYPSAAEAVSLQHATIITGSVGVTTPIGTSTFV